MPDRPVADNTHPVLLLTRPPAASERFARMVQAAGLPGLEIVTSPLLDIVQRPGPIPWDGISGAIFSSRNGVEAALAQRMAPLPCCCVGRATAQVAEAAGWPVIHVTDTAEALIQTLAEAPLKGAWLHVSGQERRVDIAGRLTDLGQAASTHVAYDQVLRPLSDTALRLLRGARPVVAPLFSPRTARHFAREHNGDAPLWLVALSPAVAEPLDCLDAKALRIAERPNADAMQAAVVSLWKQAMRLEPPGQGD